MTSSTWSGTVSGAVNRTFDNNFRVISDSVNGVQSVTYGYDNDGLLTQAGSLAIGRNLQNGLITGTTLGSLTDSYTYSVFGEVTGYQASFGTTSYKNLQYTRDNLGRITQKVEDGNTYAYSYDLAGRLTDVSLENRKIGSGFYTSLATLGITTAEQQQLALLYPAGKSLWRVLIPHFSTYSYNWITGSPSIETQPFQSQPFNGSDMVDQYKCACENIQKIQNQDMERTYQLYGVPYTLNYQSSRMSGRVLNYTTRIPLTGSTLPANLKRIDLEIYAGGRTFTNSFPATPDQSYTFTWDGIDVYGRKLQGAQEVSGRIGYVYPGSYQVPPNTGSSFGIPSGVSFTGVTSNQEVTDWQVFSLTLGGLLSDQNGLGGWDLNIHHQYDPTGNTPIDGAGGKKSRKSFPDIIQAAVAKPRIAPSSFPNCCSVAGNTGDGGPALQAYLNFPRGLSFGPDGSLYIADTGNNRIRKVDPSGIITTIAGEYCTPYNSGGGYPCPGGYRGDGLPATAATLNSPTGVAVGPDGSIYIADMLNNRIRKIDLAGIITTVAGNGIASFSGDGGPATQAQLSSPGYIAVDGFGSIYFSDLGNNRVRRIGSDGIINTVAGNGLQGFPAKGVPATSVPLTNLGGLTVDSKGNLFFAAQNGSTFGWNGQIYQVRPDGIIFPVKMSLIGLSWRYANFIGSLTISPDGTLYFTIEALVGKVTPDGKTRIISGTSITQGDSGDGGFAKRALFGQYGPEGIAIAPDRSIYVSDPYWERVRRITSPFPSFSNSNEVFTDKNGRWEYIFDANGRHLQTKDTKTGAIIYSFTYDSSGRLVSTTDASGNITTIQRDAFGNPASIIAPGGQMTSLSLDSNGYLASLTNPLGQSVRYGYSTAGLLTSKTDPNGNITQYSYDPLGILKGTQNPLGGISSLTRNDFSNGYSVSLLNPFNQTSSYQVLDLANGDQQKINTNPAGLILSEIDQADGTRVINSPDGMVTTIIKDPDPRFGMLSPLISSGTIATPGGLVLNLSQTGTVNLADPTNPLSLTTSTYSTSINGFSYTTTYVASTNQKTITTPTGRTTVTKLDNQSRPLQQQVGSIAPKAYSYDSIGRLTSLIQGSGSSTRTQTFTYDSKNQLTALTDAYSRSTGFVYDLSGRLTAKTLPDGRVINYTYDPSGNVTSVTPPTQPPHNFGYNAANLTQSYSPPLLGTLTTATSYTYNINKQVTQIIRPDGKTISYGYDSASRLSTILTSSGQMTYAYNPSTGKLSNITAPDGGTLGFTYDGSLVTSSTWSGTVAGSFNRAYDNNFRVVSDNVNGAQSVSYGYDSDGLLTQAGALNINRDLQNGLVAGTTLGSLTDGYNYSNGFGEMTGYQATYGNGLTLKNIQYTRDNLGRITQKIEDGNTYAYSYDLAGRLTDVSLNGINQTHYIYDGNSNRLSVTTPAGTISGTYDAQDRLVSYGANSYTYTNNGELLTKTNTGGTTTYSYDVLGNLLSVALPNGTRVDYVVDGQNRRIGKKINGSLLEGYLYSDQLRIVATLDMNNAIISRFIYGSKSNIPDYMVKAGNTYRIISDHLGSPRLVVDVVTGNIAQAINYDEFGNVTSDTQPGFQPFGFVK